MGAGAGAGAGAGVNTSHNLTTIDGDTMDYIKVGQYTVTAYLIFLTMYMNAA